MSQLAWDIFSWFLLAVAIPAIPVCGARLLSYIQSKTQASWLKVLEDQLTKIAMDVVLASFQTTRAEIARAKDPASDGGVNITAAEGKKIFDKAVLAARDSLGAQFIKLIGKVLGPTVVDARIASKIEAAVLTAKQAGIDKRPSSIGGGGGMNPALSSQLLATVARPAGAPTPEPTPPA